MTVADLTLPPVLLNSVIARLECPQREVRRTGLADNRPERLDPVGPSLLAEIVPLAQRAAHHHHMAEERARW